MLVLKCPHCGADLTIAPDMDVFACGYCGSKQMVRREGGTVSLKLIGDAIAKVQVGTDRTAAELAVRRLREDLAAIQARRAELTSNIATQKEDADARLTNLAETSVKVCATLIAMMFVLPFLPCSGLLPFEASTVLWVFIGAGLVSLAVAVVALVFRYVAMSRRQDDDVAMEDQRLSLRMAEIQAEIDDHLTFLSGPAR